MEAVINRPVGRPRKFDENVVLQAAMAVFWRQGYDGTSMADLLKATGLHKGSLYQAFGDKHSLFVRALRNYIADMKRTMAGLLEDSGSALEGLRAALYYEIEMGLDEEGNNSGCLMLNTLVEKGSSDEEVLGILSYAYAKRMEMITGAVARAQAEGDIRRDWAPDRIANLVQTVIAGLMVELKGPYQEAMARSLIDDLLATLA